MSKSVSEASWSIAAVERETGLSKDILRIWERRYGFPAPARDGQGDRLYSMAELGRLRMLAKLIDQGHRPGRLMPIDDSGLEALLAAPAARSRKRVAGSETLGELSDMMVAHRLQDLRSWLEKRCADEGRPVLALTLLGVAEQLRIRFLDGVLSVFEMDLFAAEALRVVHSDPAGGPGVVLAAADAEVGYLELRLLQAIVAGTGSACILLPQAERQLANLPRFLRDSRPAALCLAFSPTTRLRQITSILDTLRPALPAEIQLLVTLAGTQHPPQVDFAQCVAASELAGVLQRVSSPV